MKSAKTALGPANNAKTTCLVFGGTPNTLLILVTSSVFCPWSVLAHPARIRGHHVDVRTRKTKQEAQQLKRAYSSPTIAAHVIRQCLVKVFPESSRTFNNFNLTFMLFTTNSAHSAATLAHLHVRVQYSGSSQSLKLEFTKRFLAASTWYRGQRRCVQ